MEPEKILSSSLIDILFENRNKEYGAYDLRNGYPGRMMIAVFSCVMFIFLLIVFYHSFKATSLNSSEFYTVIKLNDTVRLIERPTIVKPLVREPAATIKNVSPRIVQEDEEPPPVIEELRAVVAMGTETIDGPTPPDDVSTSDNYDVDRKAETIQGQLNETTGKILMVAEKMPEFPGGDAALRRYLNRNLKFPGEELNPGTRIKLLVRFVVESDGTVVGIHFVQSAGEIYEHEIRRVVNKMPRWKPGSQNGKNVAVYFQIPIIFEVPD